MIRACVFSIDDAYVMPFQVFFTSLELTDSIPAVSPIFILHTNALSNDSIRNIEVFLKQFGRTATFLDATNKIPAGLPIREGDHVSPATFYRLFIAEILPPVVEQAIYLDSDMLALRNISSLFTEPVTGMVAAADHCSPAEGIRLWGAGGGDYFQAGVLVIPVRTWKQEGMSRGFEHVMQAEAARIRWWDQDILNIALQGRWQRLPVWLNVGQHVQRLFPHEVVKAQARLIHFDGSDKPWKCASPSLFAPAWEKAYQEVFAKPFSLTNTHEARWRRLTRALRTRVSAAVRRYT